MSSSVEEILKESGPSLSSVVRETMVNKLGISETNARQRISRSKGNVCRVITIKFPKNEKFLYLKEQYGSYEYWEKFIEALKTTNSAYGDALQSIIARGSVIPKEHFHILSGSPLQLKNHVGSQNILNGLIRSKLLKIEEYSRGQELITLDTEYSYSDEIDINGYKARLIVEEILSTAIVNWLKKTGLASYSAVQTRTLTSAPKYGQFEWDITTPSYVYPLVHKTSSKTDPGFIVVDYVVGSKLSESQVKYFIKKCKILRSIKTIKPFLSILVSDSFSKNAFKLGKKEGVIFTTPEILFGREVSKSLQELLGTLKNAAAVSVKNPEKITELFNKLSTIEGASINLRGALFELIVAHLVQKKEGGSVDIGVNLINYDNGNKAEVDVRLNKGDHKVIIYECKARSKSNKISITDVEHWVNDRIPLIRGCLLKLEQFKNRELHFEYWTTGEFDEDAVTLLKSKKTALRKYTIDWKDGKKVLEYGKSAKSKAMTDFLKEHFLKHPLNC